MNKVLLLLGLMIGILGCERDMDHNAVCKKCEVQFPPYCNRCRDPQVVDRSSEITLPPEQEDSLPYLLPPYIYSANTLIDLDNSTNVCYITIQLDELDPTCRFDRSAYLRINKTKGWDKLRLTKASLFGGYVLDERHRKAQVSGSCMQAAQQATLNPGRQMNIEQGQCVLSFHKNPISDSQYYLYLAFEFPECLHEYGFEEAIALGHINFSLEQD